MALSDEAFSRRTSSLCGMEITWTVCLVRSKMRSKAEALKHDSPVGITSWGGYYLNFHIFSSSLTLCIDCTGF